MSYKGTNWIDTKTGKPKNAPCRFALYDDAAQRDVSVLPEVNCQGECGKCGFNPSVKARRLSAARKAAKKKGKAVSWK